MLLPLRVQFDLYLRTRTVSLGGRWVVLSMGSLLWRWNGSVVSQSWDLEPEIAPEPVEESFHLCVSQWPSHGITTFARVFLQTCHVCGHRVSPHTSPYDVASSSCCTEIFCPPHCPLQGAGNLWKLSLHELVSPQGKSGEKLCTFLVDQCVIYIKNGRTLWRGFS